MTKSWHRKAAGVLAVAVMFLASIATQAQQQQPPDNSNNQPVTYHGVEFPMAFADGQRFSTRDYEATNPGLGFSAGYRHRGAVTTVFIYDLKQPPLPDDLGAPVVKQQFDQASNDIRRAMPAGGTLNSKGSFVVSDASGRPRVTCEGFELQRSSSDPMLDTFVCVGVAKGKFFKVRTSMPRQNGSRDEVMRFVGAWAEKL